MLGKARSGQGPKPAALLLKLQVPAGYPGSVAKEAAGLTGERENKVSQSSRETGGIGERIRGGKEMGPGHGRGIDQAGRIGGWNLYFFKKTGTGNKKWDKNGARSTREMGNDSHWVAKTLAWQKSMSINCMQVKISSQQPRK